MDLREDNVGFKARSGWLAACLHQTSDIEGTNPDTLFLKGPCRTLSKELSSGYMGPPMHSHLTNGREEDSLSTRFESVQERPGH